MIWVALVIAVIVGLTGVTAFMLHASAGVWDLLSDSEIGE